MKEKKRPAVEVAVYDYKSNVLPNARVTLKPLGQEKKEISLQFDKQWRLFRVFDVTPGHYLLRAEAEGFESDHREVQVDPSGLKDTFVLGKKGMPFYYRGKVKVPFEPPRDLLGVSVKPDLSGKQEEELLAYARELKLQPEKVGEPIREDNVRVFRFPPRTDEQNRRRIQQRLSEHPLVRLVGPLIGINKESVSFLTNELVVRFKVHITREEVYTIAKRYELNLVREIPYAGNAFLLRAGTQASYDLLKICAEIVESGIVEYAEPNLVVTAVDLQINPTDFLSPEQWHIPLINLPNAWQLLRNANPPGVMPGDPGDLTLGSEDRIIAVMDRGIQSQTIGGVTTSVHPDFDGDVTSGNYKVYRFYDFANMVPNNDNIPNSHGMGCAGVAAALANNLSVIPGIMEGVVGAAPNCRVMGLIRPAGGTEVQYTDAYIWTAGFNPGWIADNVNYPVGTVFPALIKPGADIISNSFVVWGSIVAGGLMQDCFNYLTTYGRGGKGIPVFFAAGNSNDDFNIDFHWAAYGKTIAVAASSLANDGITEVRATYSNFGNGIDFCAPSSAGRGFFHNPPVNYGIITCDLLGQGNMPGHPATQTALSQVAAPAPFTTLAGPALPPDFVWIPSGTATLDVGNNAGFAVNQWIRLGQYDDPNAEWVQITAIPPGGNQLTTTATTQWHRVGTPVIGVTTLNVNNNAGFVANQWLLLEQPGQAGAESVLIRDIPAGNTQIRVAGPLNNHGINTPVIGGPLDYRNNFGGTSSATPLVAGVAALMLSINPDLTWVQVRQILRDTAVQIDAANVDPIGQWVDTDGDGIADYSQWYGHGRVDAQAAVQEAINLFGVNPLTHIDTWIKENSADVGDVPSEPPYSPDVWVRNVDPALDSPAQVTQHQSPIRGQDNWVYANIRNRGAIDSHDIYVRIFITRWAGSQYIYPDDFIPTVPPSTNPIQPLAPGTYLIDEVHIDSIPAGGVVTINAIWPAALVPPASVVIDGVTYSWADACLLVDVSPHDGPTPTGNYTWDNNNICQRNVFPVDPGDSDDLAIGFVVGHHTNYANLLNLRIDRKHLPAGVKLFFDYVDKGVTREATRFLDELKERPHMLETCDLAILTEAKGEIHCRKTGGTSPVIIAPKTHLTLPCCPLKEKPTYYQLNPVLKENRTVFAVPTVQRVYVPIPRKRGKYQVVALLGKGLRNLEKGEYQIDVYQEDLIGKVEGSLNFVIRKT